MTDSERIVNSTAWKQYRRLGCLQMLADVPLLPALMACLCTSKDLGWPNILPQQGLGVVKFREGISRVNAAAAT